MRNNSTSSWITKIVWLAGLILIIFGRDYLNQNVLWRMSSSQEGYNLFVWLNFLLPFLTGVYLSLLLVWSGFRANDPSLLFLVAIPTLIVALLPPLVMTLRLQTLFAFGPIITALNSGQIMPLVAGLTLWPSINRGTTKRRRR